MPIKLNLGCGSNKIDGFINIDSEESCKPDLVVDFLKKPLPFERGSISEVVLFHTIEHISKRLHRVLLTNIWNLLEPGGLLIISYPEFLKCVENWKTNYKGKKEFWEATIFGRQLYPSDTHVALMCTEDFTILLESVGFRIVKASPEPLELYNTVVVARKFIKPITYEEAVQQVTDSIELH